MISVVLPGGYGATLIVNLPPSTGATSQTLTVTPKAGLSGAQQVFVQSTQPQKILGIPWVWAKTEADAVVDVYYYNGMVV